MNATKADLLRQAKGAALQHARSIESNVVQDRIIIESVNAAINVLEPYIAIPETPTPPKRRWYQKRNQREQ